MTKRLLITGATGKVGQAFITRFWDDPHFADFTVRALCHNRTLPPHDRLEVVRGSLSDQNVVNQALEGVTQLIGCRAVLTGRAAFCKSACK